MTRRSEIEKIVDYIAEDARAIHGLLEDSVGIQWEAPKRQVHEGPRPKGAFSDPVPMIALDERRLAVRHSRKEALEALVLCQRELDRVRSRLISSIERWRE